MAHNFESGFVVREPAWHGLATVLDDYPDNWDDARRLAGLDWDPIVEPMFVRNERGNFVKVDDHNAIMRDDTRAVLATASKSYSLFDNESLGPLVESLLDVDDDVQYETAGVLKGGRKVWVSLRLREPFEVPGDPRGATLPRLVVQNSHDGSTALRAQRLQTRIVCDNTSHAADREAQAHGYEFTFRHTSNIVDRVDDAKRAIAGLKSDRAAYLEWANDLLGIDVTEAQRELFVNEFVPSPPTDAVVSNRVLGNINEARAQVRAILSSPTTVDTAHTAYGLVQAGVEYLDHVRSYRDAETHFSRTYLRREPMKRKVEALAREVANA